MARVGTQEQRSSRFPLTFKSIKLRLPKGFAVEGMCFDWCALGFIRNFVLLANFLKSILMRKMLFYNVKNWLEILQVNEVVLTLYTSKQFSFQPVMSNADNVKNFSNNDYIFELFGNMFHILVSGCRLEYSIFQSGLNS